MLHGGLTLTSPGWLWGMAAAAAVVLVAHLLSRRPGRVAVFSSVRFLRAASEARRQRVRVRDWLLLALRGVALCLVAGAFARPLWQARARGGAGRGSDVILVLDRSASMMRVQHGSTLFAQARAQVVSTLQELDPAGDRAAVILVDGRPHSLLPQPTAGISEFSNLVQQVQPTQECGDLAGALALVPALVAPQPGVAGRPVVIEVHSDMQASQWPAVSPAAILPPTLRRPGVEMRLRPVGHAEPNLTIRLPAVSPAFPVAGQAAVVSAEVVNFGARAAAVTVRLEAQGQTHVAPLRVPARGAAEASFSYLPRRVGAQLVTLTLEGPAEDFTLDKSTGLLINVAAGWRVLLVTDKSTDDPAAAAYYVARALAPEAPAAGGMSQVALATCRPDDLAALLGANRPMFVVVVEAGAIGPEGRGALRDYLAGGGSALWVIDSAQAAAALRQLGAGDLDQHDTPVMPGLGGERWWRTDLQRGISDGRFDDPVLAVFEGPSRALLLRQTFRAGLVCQAAPSAEALLTLADGSPLLAAQWRGRGRLAVLTAPLNPEATGMVREPVFLPLVQQIVRALSPGAPPPGNPHPGQSAVISVSARATDAPLRVRGPGAESVAFTAAMQGQTTLVRIARVDRVGPYVVEAADTGQILGGTYVDLDPAESDLATLPPAAAPAPGAAAHVTVGAAGASHELSLHPLELWPFLAGAAVALMALEQCLLWLWPMKASVGDGAGGQTGVPGRA